MLLRFALNAHARPGTLQPRRKSKCLSVSKRIQQVSDAAQVTYDRDGTSMCPDGTFSRDWGSRVLSVYEQFDLGMLGLEDLDEALGGLFASTAAAEQALVAEDVDLILGAVTATNSNRYAP